MPTLWVKRVSPQGQEYDEVVRTEYIDTRGKWPLYVNGVNAVSLEGHPMDIELHDAARIAAEIQRKAVTLQNV